MGVRAVRTALLIAFLSTSNGAAGLCEEVKIKGSPFFPEAERPLIVRASGTIWF